MTVLKIDMATGDLAVENGSWVSISGIEEIAQDVWVVLGLILGELVFDTSKGMPFVGELTEAGTPVTRLEALYRDAILSRPGVRSMLEGPRLTYDAQARALGVSFRADTDEGELVFSRSISTEGT